jgi:adhesin transport system membrane fusion protein
MKLGRKINGLVSTRQLTKSRHTTWLIAVTVTILVAWSAHAPLDEIVRGIGKVVPTMKNQIIQNLEGGIVTELLTTEGETVESGQLLVKMDETRFQSANQELQDQHWALTLRLARLQAEEDFSSNFVPDAKLLQLAPEHTASELQLFKARREEMRTAVRTQQDAIDLQMREVNTLRPMVKRSAVPKIELIRAEQAAAAKKSLLSATKTEFETARSQEYSETLLKLRQIDEQLLGSEDQLLRTNVRSPIRGIVNKVHATTIGGVIQPGEPLLEILSLEDNLRVEGKIDPRDIGFVYVGMPATVKLMAFDFSIYGVLEGRVIHVGADTVTDEQQREPLPYYEVFIELKTTTLDGSAGQVDIRPGMQAEIELHSGQKTVLQYILKPLFKTTEALTER